MQVKKCGNNKKIENLFKKVNKIFDLCSYSNRSRKLHTISVQTTIEAKKYTIWLRFRLQPKPKIIRILKVKFEILDYGFGSMKNRDRKKNYMALVLAEQKRGVSILGDTWNQKQILFCLTLYVLILKLR